MASNDDIKFSSLAQNFKGTALLQKTRGDKVIWALVLLLVVVSMLVVYSATGSLAYKKHQGDTEFFLFKQIGFICIGFIIIYFAHLVHYIIYSRVAKILFLISIPLLLYTLFFGVTMNQGSRWIRLPLISMTMQTSDLAKLALFMLLARILSRKQAKIKDFKKGFLPVIIPVAVTCMLIAPANLSTALLLGSSCMLLMFIGRISVKHLALVIGIALIPLTFLIAAAVIKHGSAGNEDDDVTAVKKVKTSRIFARVDTWIGRVENFMYGTTDHSNDDDHYQKDQANIATARGGLFGVGPGHGEAKNFLPQAYNDYIYATLIEEYGLLGGAFIVFIYIVFLYRSIRLFKKCPYAFGAFLALGLSFTLVLQALANMAVNVGLFPVTGVTLPLVSMGGSSFLFTCLSIGIILSVSRNVEQLEGKKAAALAAAIEANKQLEEDNDDEEEEYDEVEEEQTIEA